jgi:putative NADPH-quinone reductase
MSARARFTQADVCRAVKAVERAGLSVARVKFTRDGFELVAGEPDERDNADWFAGGPLYRDVA